MRRIIFSLALAFSLAGMAFAGDGAPKVGTDGSLVLERGRDSRKATGSSDTLYDLLGKEVQVYIFSHKARMWPPPTARVYTLGYRSSWSGPRDPRVDLLINKYAGVYGVDPALVRAVVRNESGFDPLAVSPKGAQGLMQLMPGTASLMGVQNPFDPEQNIAGGVGYLRYCLDRFGHNVPLAVAAYNAGPEAVARYCNIPPYLETQLFVSNVLGTYGGYGPNQTLKIPAPNPNSIPNPNFIPNPNVKAPPANLKKTAKSAPEKDQDAPKEVHRRPKAKIIEVRSSRTSAKPIAILKD